MKKKKKKTKIKKKAKKNKTKKVIRKKTRKFLKKKSIKKTSKSKSSSELTIKTKPEWIKASLANKSQYQKKYKDSIKNNNTFWKKEGKRIRKLHYKKFKRI